MFFVALYSDGRTRRHIAVRVKEMWEDLLCCKKNVMCWIYCFFWKKIFAKKIVKKEVKSWYAIFLYSSNFAN